MSCMSPSVPRSPRLGFPSAAGFLFLDVSEQCHKIDQRAYRQRLFKNMGLGALDQSPTRKGLTHVLSITFEESNRKDICSVTLTHPTPLHSLPKGMTSYLFYTTMDNSKLTTPKIFSNHIFLIKLLG